MRTRSLPRHARTGQLALGWRRPRPGEDGPQPIWPILGGAPADGEQDNDSDDQGDEGDGSGTDDGDQGDAEPDHKAEAEKWKALARKQEQRAKANAEAAKELAKIKREGMSDVEKRVDEAVAAARAEERARAGAKVARQAFLAAAAGRLKNAKDVADELNLKKYVDEDGEVDEDAISDLVDRLAPGSDTDDEDDEDARDTRRRRRPARGYQGARNGSGRSKSKRGAVDGDELFKELFGRSPRTSTS
jgi:hypothetical protein